MTQEEDARFFKALADPIRLRIIDYLREKGNCSCICHLSEHLGRDQSVIFRHLGILRDAGIVSAKKDGKYLLCCVKDIKKIEKILRAAHG